MLKNPRCLLVILLMTKWASSSKFEFTNVQCTSFDKSFDDFEYCYIRSANRSYKYLSAKVNLFKTPITKAKITLILYKRFNGYRPFMFNVTLDACRFLRNTDSSPIGKYFYDFFNSYSNINHTCPFKHDMIVEKIPIDFVNHRVTKVLPFPEGDYLLETHWIAYDIDRAMVKIYYTIS
ncbi:GM26239 [Drosophila sechellia]|uniref:GM26239 n=1 Tax=Drosophila sechellia TaxID=7238 RepID=B4HJX3_DROSE|nr:GM26239 [Drosophila sechellia]